MGKGQGKRKQGEKRILTRQKMDTLNEEVKPVVTTGPSIKKRKTRYGSTTGGKVNAAPPPAPTLTEEECRKIKAMPFQAIFYNQDNQKTGFEMLLKATQNLTGNSVKALPIIKKGANTSTKSNHRKSSTPVIKTSQELEAQKAKVKSVAMVQELMDRYERNKKKDLKDKRAKSLKIGEDDDFDYDELLWEEELESGSDFLKHTVPQWELKMKLFEKHCDQIKLLTPEKVEKVCQDVMPELRKIINKEVPSERHRIFKVCGLSKQPLRNMTVGAPFTSAQDYRVTNAVNNVFLTKDSTGDMMSYIMHVLVPESLIRIFAAVNAISYELADRELTFGASYDGILDEDVIKTLINSNQEEGPVTK